MANPTETRITFESELHKIPNVYSFTAARLTNKKLMRINYEVIYEEDIPVYISSYAEIHLQTEQNKKSTGFRTVMIYGSCIYLD